MPTPVVSIPGLAMTNPGTPRVSPQAAAAPAQALGDVASAIGSISRPFAEIADRLQEAENQRALSTTRTALDESRSKLFIDLQTVTDPAEHIRRTDDFLQQSKTALDDPSLAPVVRDRLIPYFDQWASDTRTTVAERAAKLTQERARLAANNELQAAQDAGDITRAATVIDEQIASGLMLPEQGDQIKHQLQQQITFRNITKEIEADPLAAPDMVGDDLIEKYPELSLEDADRLRDFADRSQQSARAEFFDGIAAAAENGQTLAPDDLRAMVEEGILTPTQSASYLRTYHGSAPPEADPELYDAVHDTIMAYDPAADPTGRALADLRADIATLPLPKDHVAELRKRLNNRATASADSPTHRLAKDFSAITAERFDQGMFGSWFSAKGTTKTIDRAGYETAIGKKREFLDAWDAYLENAPANLSPAEARQTYDTLFDQIVNSSTDFDLLQDFAPAYNFDLEADQLLDQSMVLPPRQPDQATFGGQPIQPAGRFYKGAKPTVFGGQADPVDNGRSAFGGVTGPGGREGVAIPADILKATFPGKDKAWWAENVRVVVRTPAGGQHVFPLADLGTAEWVWEKNQRPTLDLTPGALQRLGGRVLKDRNGNQVGTAGIDNLDFAITTVDAGMPMQGASWNDVWQSWFATQRPTDATQIQTAFRALLARYEEENLPAE